MGSVQIKRSYTSMVGGCVVFGVVVSVVVGAGLPIDVVMALLDAVADPVVAHVNCTGTLLPDGVVGDADGGGVVGLYGCGGLWVAHFFKDCADDGSFFHVDEESTDFGFGSSGGDVFEDTRGVENGGVVDFGFSRGVAEVEVATRAAACFGCVEIAGVTVDFETHVTGVVFNDGVGMGGTVVEELVGVVVGGFGGFALCGGEGTECDEEGVVDTAAVVLESADDLLDALFAVRREEGSSVLWVG